MDTSEQMSPTLPDSTTVPMKHVKSFVSIFCSQLSPSSYILDREIGGPKFRDS